MQPKNSFILPSIGLLLPFALYMFLASKIAPVLTSINFSNDSLLLVLGIAYLLVVLWSNVEAKSQTKFFIKYYPDQVTSQDSKNKKNAKTSRLRRGSSFFIHIIGNITAIFLWLFFFPDEALRAAGVSNVWYQLASLLIIMFFASNIVKVFVTSKFAQVDIKTSLNSLKFVILSDVFWYGIVCAYFLLLGGFFV